MSYRFILLRSCFLSRQIFMESIKVTSGLSRWNLIFAHWYPLTFCLGSPTITISLITQPVIKSILSTSFFALRKVMLTSAHIHAYRHLQEHKSATHRDTSHNPQQYHTTSPPTTMTLILLKMSQFLLERNVTLRKYVCHFNCRIISWLLQCYVF